MNEIQHRSLKKRPLVKVLFLSSALLVSVYSLLFYFTYKGDAVINEFRLEPEYSWKLTGFEHLMMPAYQTADWFGYTWIQPEWRSAEMLLHKPR